MPKKPVTPAPETKTSEDRLADALVAAINSTKPRQKVSMAQYKPRTPWSPPDGVAKLKLKRKIYQHSIHLTEEKLTNAQIELLNRLRPGIYCDGWITVTRRRDKGINIDYPFKTPAQRMKLSSSYGITSFAQLVERCNQEADLPKKTETELLDEEDTSTL